MRIAKLYKKIRILIKKILITGGAGFIGSNLCNAFLDYGYSVVCLDNLSTGKIENINHLLKNKNFEFIKGDIRNLQTCRNAVKGVYAVLHQAALGSIPRSINDPVTTNEVNISGFLNMLIAAKDEKVDRFIFAASSSTYGDNTELPKVEENVGKPLSPYAVTKLVNELYANVFGNIFGIKTIGLRYFNVFGKKQDPDGAYAAVIPKFINKFINHESPVINGDGNITRDFTYVENVVAINKLALETTNNEAFNKIYNVAYGKNINLNELVVLIKKYLSKYDNHIANIDVIYGKPRPADIHDSLASIEKAKKYLNYNPKFSVDDGLKLAINWYWNNLK